MPHSIDKSLSIKDYPVLLFKGFLIGIANIIPGVSGGTMALMLGIYEDLLRSLRSLDLNFLKRFVRFEFNKAFDATAWKFTGLLVGGAFLAILSSAKLLKWLLVHEAIFTNSFFFGLILATVPIVARIIQRWSPMLVGLVVISAVATLALVQMTPVTTTESLWFVFLCGAIAISSMILPGISGSFMLLVLGKYEYILEAINNRDILTLSIFMAGMFLGIVLFVRILGWLFQRFHDATMAVLTGFVIGSLVKIWPWKIITKSLITLKGKTVPIEQINIIPEAIDIHLLLSVVFIFVGLGAAFLLAPDPKTSQIKI